MLNNLTIMGRLTRDPEMKRTGSGVPVVQFTIAVEDDFAKDESGKKQVDFIECTAWRNDAEYIAKYFTKGRMIVVVGRLKTKGWTDKEGNKCRDTYVLVSSAYFGDSKKDGGQGSPTGNYAGNNPNYGAQQSGYAPAPPQSGYAPAPQQGGYGTPNGWASPTAPGNFVMLDDDDAQLPF